MSFRGRVSGFLCAWRRIHGWRWCVPFRDAGKDAEAPTLLCGVTEDPVHPVQPGGKIRVKWERDRGHVSGNFMTLKRFEPLLQSRSGENHDGHCVSGGNV